MEALIILGAAIAITLAFGRDASAANPAGARFGEPGFDSTTVAEGTKVRATGASYVKVGAGYYDAATGAQITPAEAKARAQREGFAFP